MKTCPECAEQVHEAARVCRYCAHRFAPARGRSSLVPVVVAAVLVIVVGTVVLFSTGVLPPPLSKVEYEERMQALLSEANRETGEQSETIKPSESPESARRAFRAQGGTLSRLVDDLEEISAPRAIRDEHDDLTEAYDEVAGTARRAAGSPDWAASDSGQRAINASVDDAGAAEGRVRGRGYDIGDPYF